MNRVFLLTSLLVLSGLSLLPPAQAVEPCTQEPGYRQCLVEGEYCQADVRYYQHDSFFTQGVGCQVSTLHCGYYSHSLYGYWTGADCENHFPATESHDPTQPCESKPGYQDCTASAGGCTVGFWYYQHDGIFHPVTQCDRPEPVEDCTQYPGYEICDYSVAGVCVLRVKHFFHDQIYQLYPLCDKAPFTVGGPPGAEAEHHSGGPVNPDEPVDCYGPLDGYQYCEATVGKCHAGEDLWDGTYHAHAECQPNDGKSRCGVDVYSAPLEVWRHCGSTYERVFPVSVGSAAAPAAPAVGPECGVEPSLSPFWNVDVNCSPVVSCRINGIEDGFPPCVFNGAGCLLETTGFDRVVRSPMVECHDSSCVLYVDGAADSGHTYMERCQLPEDTPWIGILGAPAASAAYDPCEEKPGYRECTYGTADCGVKVYYVYHDAMFFVEPYCYKAASSSGTSDPVDCQGTDGLLTCETATVAGCGAGFYSRDQTRWAYAGCTDPTSGDFCGLDYDAATPFRHWVGCN